MTREESLKILRDTHDKALFSVRNALETLIPELRENESERIRQMIENTLRDAVLSERISDTSYREMSAYLEKQKELFKSGKGLYYYDGEKTTYYSHFTTEENPYDFAISQQEKQKEQKPAEESDVVPIRFEEGNGEKYPIVDYKLMEQKPSEWSEDDEDMIVDIIDIIQSDKAVAKIDPDHPASQERLAYYDKEITFLKSLLEGVKCRLKTEWSEEDDKAVYFINQFLEYHEASDPTAKSCKEWFNRFKSLRPQPKAEWSEEDEKIITRLIDYFESFRIAGVAIKWEGLDIQEVITLLKSLRPSWKPSEDEERLINTSISFLKDFADKGYENAVECIDWLKSKLNGNSGK